MESIPNESAWKSVNLGELENAAKAAKRQNNCKKSESIQLRTSAPKFSLPSPDPPPRPRHPLGRIRSLRAAAGRARLLASSGRRGIGRLPRKCKLRGPRRVTVHFAYVSRTFRRGLRFLANSGKTLANVSQNLANF